MSNTPSPQCSVILNKILGYLAWKQEVLSDLRSDSRYEDWINRNIGGPGRNNFYWKEVRWLLSKRKDCFIKERYHYFTLDEKFDNESYSYEANSTDSATGTTERVTYQIEPDSSTNSYALPRPIEAAVIRAVEKTISTYAPAYNKTGATSLNNLQEIRPVPRRLRVWTITQEMKNGEERNYVIAGRLKGRSGSKFLLEQPLSAGVDPQAISFVKMNKEYENKNASAADNTYINQATYFTYQQRRNFVVFYEPYFDFSGKPVDEKSWSTRVFYYTYDRFMKRYDLKRTAINRNYVWDDFKNRTAKVTQSQMREKPTVVQATVIKTTPDGCKSKEIHTIGYVDSRLFECAYYSLPPSNRTERWQPGTSAACPKSKIFDSINSNISPFSQAFRNALDNILPFNPPTFGDDGADDLAQKVTKDVVIVNEEKIPPDNYATFGTRIVNNDLTLGPKWEIVNHN